MSNKIEADEDGAIQRYAVWHHDGDDMPTVPKRPNSVEANSFTHAAEIFAADDFATGDWRDDRQSYGVMDEAGRIILVSVRVDREPVFEADSWDESTAAIIETEDEE